MDPVLAQLKQLSATTVSDALDRLGIAGQCLGIKPLAPAFRLCGRAFTMRTVPLLGNLAPWVTTSTTYRRAR